MNKTWRAYSPPKCRTAWPSRACREDGCRTDHLDLRAVEPLVELRLEAVEVVVLRFEGKEVRFPAQAREALAAAHSAEGPFTAASLPGALDEPGRLVLVRRLVREGYLRRV